MQNGLKQGGALSPLLFNFALDYAVKKSLENQMGLKLNAAQQLLSCADNVNVPNSSDRTKPRDLLSL
jgi:hypothetical protein